MPSCERRKPIACDVTTAARMLGRSRPHVDRLIADGRLRCTRHGRRFMRIPIADVERVLAESAGSDR